MVPWYRFCGVGPRGAALTLVVRVRRTPGPAAASAVRPLPSCRASSRHTLKQFFFHPAMSLAPCLRVGLASRCCRSALPPSSSAAPPSMCVGALPAASADHPSSAGARACRQGGCRRGASQQWRLRGRQILVVCGCKHQVVPIGALIPHVLSRAVATARQHDTVPSALSEGGVAVLFAPPSPLVVTPFPKGCRSFRAMRQIDYTLHVLRHRPAGDEETPPSVLCSRPRGPRCHQCGGGEIRTSSCPRAGGVHALRLTYLRRA